MTNLHTKIVFIAISALLITLAGCKKDDPSPGFTPDTSALDFEWGQSKEVFYTATEITGFSAPTVPKGWTCVHNGDRFIITSPREGGDSDLSGNISLSATTKSGTNISRNVAVAVKIAEEITSPPANSIIITEPGKRFKFKALRRGNETAETITGATKAVRLWSSAKTGVINVSLENGYVYFATGGTTSLAEGNAVVALTDKDDNVLWSWHIWTVIDDPGENPDILGGVRVMNRNLGAFENSNASDGDAVRSYGLYYQWGRKDPFIGPLVWNITTPHAIYNPSNYQMRHLYVTSTAETGTMDYAVSHPNTFIAGYNESGNYNWLVNPNTTGLWNSASKSLYDPCPAGWRVAPPTIWASFTTTGNTSANPSEFNVDGEYKYGWTFVNGGQTVFFPAAGRRSFSPSLAKPEDNYTNVVNDGEGVGYPVGFYWSSAYPVPAAPAERVGALAFRHDYINPAYRAEGLAEFAPANGFPLRCAAE